MSWSPNDLVSDQDLVSYEAKILTQFGQFEWSLRRTKALEDWLWPILRANHFEPERLRTRYVADKVFGYTASSFTDYTAAASSQAADDLPLANILAAAGTDGLYVGSQKPFRGISLRMLDAVSSVAGTMQVALWRDTWAQTGVTDETTRTGGKTLSGGGAISWLVPSDWVQRPLSDSGYLYWARLRTSATPTGAAASQLGVIRRSALCAPATLRTLMLIMREAPTSQAGPWVEKAEWYEAQANEALQRALPIVGGEFDTETVDDVVDTAEAAQTSEAVSGGGWTLERA